MNISSDLNVKVPLSVSGGGNLTLSGNLSSTGTTAILSPLTIASGSTLTVSGTAGMSQNFLKAGGTFNGNLVVNAPVLLDFSNATYGGTGEVQLSYSGSIVGNGSDTAPAVPVPGPCCPTPGPAAR